jgi:hypothetical protein
MAPDDLRRLLETDASRVYSVLMRDRATRPGGRGPRRLLSEARLLFLSISEKLTPRRRLLFALAMIAALVGALGFELTWDGARHGFRVDASPLLLLSSIGALLFLLAAELVDRVLVRDELEVARHLQSELLPKTPPVVPGWAFAASWRTANDIGGDYHRFERLADGRWAVIVADASGHGMAAGLLMAVTDTALRIALELDATPAAVAELLHRALRRLGDRRSFVTLFYGRLDPATGRLDYASAGHPSPLLRRADGRIEEPARGSRPLGLAERCEPDRGELVLGPGDLLVVSTDGLFEALDERQEAFGWDRLRRAIAAPPAGALAVHDRLRAEIDRHVGAAPVSDDRTIVVVERLAVPPPPAPLPA